MNILKQKNIIDKMIKEIIKDMNEEEKEKYLKELEELKK